MMISSSTLSLLLIGGSQVLAGGSTTSTSAAAPVPSGGVYYLNDADTGNPAIKQIVFLMLENRSFDSFLGRLLIDGINPLVNGPNYGMFNTLANGTKVYLRPRSNNEPDTSDPMHYTPDVTQQLYNVYNGSSNGQIAPMSGFANNAVVAVKQGGTADQAIIEAFGVRGADSLPVTYALAQEFGIVDDWFASMPGPTQPNRHFFQCATSMGLTDNTLNVLGGPGLDILTGLPCKTTYSNMNGGGKSWKFYYDGAEPTFLLYNDFRSPMNLLHTAPFTSFQLDAAAGHLPQYSYIDPDFLGNDNHPPKNLGPGESMLKAVYDALRSSPQWNSTLLVVSYDEHGGFYDHVPPPFGPAPDNSVIFPKSGDFHFERLGPRVPTLLISPWIPKGSIFRSGIAGRHFEHSSLSATLKRFFGLANFLTARDAWAMGFQSAVNYVSKVRTDCFQTVPFGESGFTVAQQLAQNYILGVKDIFV